MPWQPAYVFLRPDGSSTFVNNPTSAMSQQELSDRVRTEFPDARDDPGPDPLAFAAGMVAAFNPCGFAMLPAYLTLVIQREGGGQLAALGRALRPPRPWRPAFLAVLLFDCSRCPVAADGSALYAVRDRTDRHSAGGCGCWLLVRTHAAGLVPARRALAPTARLGSMFGYGVGYALASLSCTAGPFLAVTGSSLREADRWQRRCWSTSPVPTGVALVVACSP